MKTRTLLHTVALAALTGLGVWIAYRALSEPLHLGRFDVDLDSAVMYWFALLVYLFICLVLYYPLRKRSWQALFMGHATAAVIALASTATVVMLGYQRVQPQTGGPAQDTGIETSTPARIDPSNQPLRLPPPDGASSHRR